jgi:hypothetical protein
MAKKKGKEKEITCPQSGMFRMADKSAKRKKTKPTL